MMSLYAQYLTEKTNDFIIECEAGFATYRIIEDQKSVYIIDIYIKPELRESGEAKAIADSIVEIAKAKGCTKLLGSVVPSNKNSTLGAMVLFAYGMKLDSATNDFILFKKDI